MASGQKGNMTPEEMSAALEKALASIAKLEAKNSELIDREKKAKTAADEAEEAREEAARLANEKSGDVEKIKADLVRQHQRDLKKLTDQLATKTAKLETLLIDNTINEALTAHNVMADDAPLVRTFLKAGAKMDEHGDVSVDGVPFGDRLSEFFASPAARRYTAAPVNSGGGAQGSSAKSAAWPTPPLPADMGRWADYAVANPMKANAQAEQWGRQDLKV